MIPLIVTAAIILASCIGGCLVAFAFAKVIDRREANKWRI
jgi:hypothetical protein